MSNIPVEQHGGHGRTLARVLGCDPASVLDLSASLNPHAPDVVALLPKLAEEVRHYPDANAATRSLASAIGVDPELIVLTNGGAEAIALVAAHWPRGSIQDPEFSLYRRHLTAVEPDAPRWRSNPNNPLGEVAPADQTSAVWDEAFYPMATGEWTRGDDTSFRLGSLTKLWACPGLRLGYVIAPDIDAAEQIRARQPNWAVNGLALAAVPILLEQTDLPTWARQLRGLREDLCSILRDEPGEVAAHSAPWVLVHHAGDLRQRLAKAAIATRDCTSFGMPDTIRIAVPNSAGLDRIATALKA